MADIVLKSATGGTIRVVSSGPPGPPGDPGEPGQPGQPGLDGSGVGSVYVQPDEPNSTQDFLWVDIDGPAVNVVNTVNGEHGDVVLGPEDIGADPTGTASNAITAHINAVNPHPEYLTQPEADDLYAPIGGGSADGPAGGDLTGNYPNPQIAPNTIVDADINTNAAIAQSKINGLVADLAGKSDTSHNHDSTYLSPNEIIAGSNVTIDTTTTPGSVIVSSSGGGGGGAPTGPAGGDLSGTYPNPQIAAGSIVDADINSNANIAQSKINGLSTALAAKANSATSVIAGSGLTGGGDLSTDRTVNVAGDATLNITADQVSVASSPRLTTGRTITLTGDVVGVSGSFDGSSNLSFATDIAAGSIVDNDIASGAAINQSKINGLSTSLAGKADTTHSHVLGDLPSTLATDAEVTTAITNHEAAPDPHAGYLKPVDVLAGANIGIARTADTATISVTGSGAGVSDLPWCAVSTGTTTLTTPSTTAAYSIPYTNQIELHGITHSTTINPERIYVTVTGVYAVIISAIMDLAVSPANQSIELWLRVNGVDVVDSTLVTQISNLNTVTTAEATYVMSLNAGDYISFHYRGSNTNCRFPAQVAQSNPTRPAAPAVVVTLNMESPVLATTGPAGGDLSGTYPNPQIAAGVIVDADINSSAAIAQSKISGLSTSLSGKVDTTRTITAGSGLSGGGDLTADRTLNVTSAPIWTTGRTIALTGDITGTSGTFDGSANLSFATDIAAGSIVNADINASAGIAQSKISGLTTDLGNKVNNVQNVTGIWSGTQAQYDAIGTKDSNTLYVIV